MAKTKVPREPEPDKPEQEESLPESVEEEPDGSPVEEAEVVQELVLGIVQDNGAIIIPSEREKYPNIEQLKIAVTRHTAGALSRGRSVQKYIAVMLASGVLRSISEQGPRPVIEESPLGG